MKRLLLIVFFFIFGFPAISFAGFFSGEKNEVVQYESRIQAWKVLITNSKSDSNWQKLNKVNQFFNRINFIEDKAQWGVEDYWASPREFLIRNAGDCEDYSIAKYFTLIAMGVPVDRLRITYATTLSQQGHMVLVYLEGKNRTPLVLDNLQKEITPFVARTDLDPVYSFNDEGLWLAHRDSSVDELVSRNTEQVTHWQSLSAKVLDDQVL